MAEVAAIGAIGGGGDRHECAVPETSGARKGVGPRCGEPPTENPERLVYVNVVRCSSPGRLGNRVSSAKVHLLRSAAPGWAPATEGDLGNVVCRRSAPSSASEALRK
mmetsp:Transcript_49236/g.141525  ORF Transcript_49236/g.141525 Transcript_49236/m.141525 type:complete len:107 (+) Transcript_49236:134-454(+)